MTWSTLKLVEHCKSRNIFCWLIKLKYFIFLIYQKDCCLFLCLLCIFETMKLEIPTDLLVLQIKENIFPL